MEVSEGDSRLVKVNYRLHLPFVFSKLDDEWMAKKSDEEGKERE
jgi:hypothetical protein